MPALSNLRKIVTAYSDVMGSIAMAFRQPNVIALMSLLVVMVTFSAIIYMLLEGWGFLDAVYFCVVTMSTVGYGDFSPQTPLGKTFTIFYLFIGIGVFVLAVSAIAEAIYHEYRDRKRD